MSVRLFKSGHGRSYFDLFPGTVKTEENHENV
jgi:hypothetical protein